MMTFFRPFRGGFFKEPRMTCKCALDDEIKVEDARIEHPHAAAAKDVTIVQSYRIAASCVAHRG